jgi:hypothetical protein
VVEAKKKTPDKSTPWKTAPPATNQEKMENLIRDRAYFLWEEKGRPEGLEMAIWLEAEREILKNMK